MQHPSRATVGGAHHFPPQVPGPVWATTLPSFLGVSVWMGGQQPAQRAGESRYDRLRTWHSRSHPGPSAFSFSAGRTLLAFQGNKAAEPPAQALGVWLASQGESSLRRRGGRASSSPADSSAPNSGLLCSAASPPRAGDGALVPSPRGNRGAGCHVKTLLGLPPFTVMKSVSLTRAESQAG